MGKNWIRAIKNYRGRERTARKKMKITKFNNLKIEYRNSII